MTQNKFNIDYTDRDLEENGVWAAYPLIEGASVKIARLSSKPIQKEFLLLSKTYRGAEFDDDIMNDVMMELFAKHVIKDWKGIMNFGKEYECTPEHAAVLLEEVPDFALFITGQCQSLHLFKRDQSQDKVEVAKDLKKKSRGKSGTAKSSTT